MVNPRCWAGPCGFPETPVSLPGLWGAAPVKTSSPGSRHDPGQHRGRVCASCRGLPSQAFEYIRYNKGIMGEDSYPYKGQVIPDSCGFTASACGAAQHRPPGPRELQRGPSLQNRPLVRSSSPWLAVAPVLLGALLPGAPRDQRPPPSPPISTARAVTLMLTAPPSTCTLSVPGLLSPHPGLSTALSLPPNPRFHQHFPLLMSLTGPHRTCWPQSGVVRTLP